MNKFKAFLKKKNVDISPKTYFITAMGAMAQGLFASLLIGTIFKTIGEWIHLDFLLELAGFAMNGYVCGAAIGIAVAAALKATPLVLYSCAAVGAAGYMMGTGISGLETPVTAGPAGAFLAVLIACELGKLESGSTKVDIILTPAVTLLSGFAVAKLICPGVAYVMYYLGLFINTATELHPFVMGMIVSCVVGIILTLPISSAAICSMIGIAGIAGGAALAGCCAQMVGFAVMSFRENRFGGLIAQGLGTSMLQMGNIVRKPVIWLPAILSSVITGPVATLVFKLECVGVSAGMGTCGLVGPLGAITATQEKDAMFWVGLLLVCIVLPAALTLLFSEIMRKLGLIKEGDLKLDL
ncbi:MAG: PTS sugar transporter subunit IIC [Ruminococcaceae bacterium]|nr:PTS sugar transporter subunit IIC [Oscillospiraceae bacterium]